MASVDHQGIGTRLFPKYYGEWVSLIPSRIHVFLNAHLSRMNHPFTWGCSWMISSITPRVTKLKNGSNRHWAASLRLTLWERCPGSLDVVMTGIGMSKVDCHATFLNKHMLNNFWTDSIWRNAPVPGNPTDPVSLLTVYIVMTPLSWRNSH